MQRLTTLLLKNSRKSKINIVYLCIIVPTILVHVLRILQTKFGIGYAIYIDCINGVVEFLLLHLSLTIFGFFRRTDRCRRATTHNARTLEDLWCADNIKKTAGRGCVTLRIACGRYGLALSLAFLIFDGSLRFV